METTDTIHDTFEKANALFKQGYDDTNIAAKLKAEGVEEHTLQEIMIRIKQLRNRKRTHNGSLMIVLGVLLSGIGFISCVMLAESNTSISFFLYGLTSLGALIIIAGLIFIFS
jgi:hypothetical protein